MKDIVLKLIFILFGITSIVTSFYDNLHYLSIITLIFGFIALGIYGDRVEKRKGYK